MPVAVAVLATSLLKIRTFDRCYDIFNAASFAPRFLFLGSLCLLVAHPLWDLVRMCLPTPCLVVSLLVAKVASEVTLALMVSISRRAPASELLE